MFLNAKLDAPNISSQFMLLQHVVELGGVHAGGERAADQPAHARAGGHVDRDAVLLEPADDADVRDAARAAAAERDADRRPRVIVGRGAERKGQQTEDGQSQCAHGSGSRPPAVVDSDPMMPRIRVLAAAALAVTVLAMTPVAGTIPQEIEQYLRQVAQFSTAEVASLDAGSVIARVVPGGADTELAVVAAVKIRASRERTVAYYQQVIAYVDGQVTTAFGRFSTPPVLADVKDLSLDAAEIAQLKSCRPRDCDIRVGGAGLDKIRAAVDWNAPDAAGQVNAVVRQSIVGYVGAYLKDGNAALVTYNDRSEPVSLQQQWQGLLANSPYLQQYSPALRDYLDRYPRATLPGARDVLYWVKEDYTGLKPVISVVHGIIVDAPDRPDRTLVVQKQLYASHYYDGSLAMATIVGATEGATPVTYLLYFNRSRGDLLKGGFGGVKRKLARDQAKKGAEDTLGTIKKVLEQTP